jgi:hypothetical protein
MDFYFGGIGKDHSWGLASETPIVVLDKKKNKFIGLKSLKKAKKYRPPFEATIYVWSEITGNWEEAQVIVLENQPSPAIGFKPSNIK